MGGALCAAWVVTRARRTVRARRRLAVLVPARPGSPRAARWPAGRARQARPPWMAPVAVLAAGWALVGGIAGCAVGTAAAYGVHRWQQRPRPATDDVEAAHRLPLAAELLAACLSAGAGPREAAEAVSRSMGGPLGERLGRTAAELALGGDPGEAWSRIGDVPGARPLARCLERAAATGAPAAGPVSRLAAGLRADRARAAAARARRTQVLITAPVGLCFLPAFLAVGVAPVVIGLAGRLL
ncbi:type II secretion system F family protein [Streptomyces changanensis]|uniref:Type II secretion system F family protein n=1 Tax=Streptomyces changanensis TaxID=2964669 RepID=A0ABY5NFY7_9ACTN|nr:MULTISPECIES: type II secretion system F family protein [Streptomyces]UUS34861.1 type II secretion system F family protein [Streptomyces changanensis]